MKKAIVTALALVVGFAPGLTGPAFAASASVTEPDAKRVKVGLLTCDVAGSVGFIIGSRREMRCVFQPSGTGQYPQYYRGRVSKWGLDIGQTNDAVISWIVISSEVDVPNGNLNGDYKGVSAEATAALGLGANLLIGGLKQNYVLQPLSLQTQSGLNLAVGVTNMRLWLGQ